MNAHAAANATIAIGPPRAQQFLLDHPATTCITSRPDGDEVGFDVVLNVAFPKDATPVRPGALDGRQSDFAFHNVGHQLPYWFWALHPRVAAWTLTYDQDDGAAWQVEIWLKGS